MSVRLWQAQPYYGGVASTRESNAFARRRLPVRFRPPLRPSSSDGQNAVLSSRRSRFRVPPGSPFYGECMLVVGSKIVALVTRVRYPSFTPGSMSESG